MMRLESLAPDVSYCKHVHMIPVFIVNSVGWFGGSTAWSVHASKARLGRPGSRALQS